MTGTAGRAGVAPRALLRDAWWACSAPAGFFLDLDARGPARPARAALAAVLAYAIGMLALALAFVRATGSDALVVVWALAALLGLPYLALVTFVGGLVLLRSTALDLRAFELTLWAWAPAGALGVSLLPAILVAPGVAALAGLAAFPVWHLVVLVAGLRILAQEKALAAAIYYLLTAVVVPGLLALIGWAAMNALA